MSLTSEERNWVSEQLPSPHLDPEPTDKEIARIAQALVQRRAEAEVRSMVDEIRIAIHAGKVAREYSWYQFAGPMPKGPKVKVLQESESHRVVQAVRPQAYKVYLPKLEVFCKEHHLDPEAMRQVGEGIIKEHRGWIRCPWNLGVNGMLGQPFKDPTPPEPFDPGAPKKDGPKWTTVRAPSPDPAIEYR